MRPYVFRRPLIGLVLLYTALLTCARFRGWTPAPGSQDPVRFASPVRQTRTTASAAGGCMVEVAGRLDREPEFGLGYVRFILRAETISSEDGTRTRVSGKILVQGPRLPRGVGWGDKVAVRGRLSAFVPASVPGSFDAREFWACREIFSRMTALNVQLIEKASPTSPQRWLSFLRQKCLRTFRRRLSRPAAELVSGLVLGKKPVGFPDMDRDFRRSGTYHLLVASGSNVGFIIGLWTLAAWWILGLPRRVVFLGAIPCAWVYTGLAGLDPPVTRAAVMVTFGLIALLIEREDRLAQAVALSAGLLLVLRPAALFEAGFQMSYAATLGIVLGVPALESLIPGERIWIRWVTAIFFTSFAAQLALSPMLLYYFHRFSWIGLLANLLAAPWAGLCLALGVILTLTNLPGLGWLTPGAGWLTDKCALGLWRAVALFARTPGAEWSPSWNGRQTAVLAVLVVATFSIWGAIHRRREGETSRLECRRYWLIVIFFWVVGLPVLYAIRSKPDAETLSIVWLDAGVGDSQIVTGPDGGITLINGGSKSFATYKLVPFLRHRAVARLHRVILTRADARHAPGLPAALEEFSADEFLCPERVWRSSRITELRAIVEQKKIPVRFIKAGESWNDSGAVFRFFGDAVTVHFGGQSALVADDLPKRVRGRISKELPVALSVLQAPGHGRFDGSDGLLATNPRWIVLSARAPSDKLAPHLAARAPSEASETINGRRIFVTGRDGSIEWRTDGKVADCFLLVKPLEYPSHE